MKEQILDFAVLLSASLNRGVGLAFLSACVCASARALNPERMYGPTGQGLGGGAHNGSRGGRASVSKTTSIQSLVGTCRDPP